MIASIFVFIFIESIKKHQAVAVALQRLNIFVFLSRVKLYVVSCGQIMQGNVVYSPKIIDEDKVAADAALNLPAFSHKIFEG